MDEENEKYSLIGIDGNAFSIMGYTRKAMKECKYKTEEIDAYVKDAMKSDYNHLLNVSIEQIKKCNKIYNEGE